MIYNFIAYAPQQTKDLGKTYNAYMGLLPKDNDYACFIDHDATWTTYNWYNIIEKAVRAHPNIGCFTALTNRVFCKWQLAKVDRGNNDISYHRDIGWQLYNKEGSACQDMTTNHWMSGVVIIIRKSTWKKIGGFKQGMLGVDNDLHQKLRKHKEKLYLIKGLYVYHWYSNHNMNLVKKRDTSHLR